MLPCVDKGLLRSPLAQGAKHRSGLHEIGPGTYDVEDVHSSRQA